MSLTARSVVAWRRAVCRRPGPLGRSSKHLGERKSCFSGRSLATAAQAVSKSTGMQLRPPPAPSAVGEWSFRASVLGCDGAFSGYLYLEANGRAAYVADGQQVVGRGVGRWVLDPAGGAVGIELSVYQYAAATTEVPEYPHRFRGFWLLDRAGGGVQSRGDWYFCPEDPREDPRHVGTLQATRPDGSTAELDGSTGSNRGLLVPEAIRSALMMSLDAQGGSEHQRSRAPGLEPGQRLLPYSIGSIPRVQYVPDWIDSDQEAEFTHIIDSDAGSWETMNTRSSQEWGAGGRCPCGRGLIRMPLPPWQQRLADALHHLEVFDGALYPMNSVRINGYSPGQGIHPHCDGPVYYPKVAILSMGSPCIFDFYPRSGNEDSMKWDPMNDVPGGFSGSSKPQLSLLLEPRSLLVFDRDAFWHHRHAIKATKVDTLSEDVVNLRATGRRPGEAIQRGRRVSLTMRHLLPRCACQG
eukprot:gnl/TRDRNA2_/TRDRNA2_52907_c0_seq1.p1 gnl/TRDRNA2_/TRDRNA2_52907_c0~~gnl/TRDRNA2_/TRDRNA2_52907_c0_seq1.p1  ORF type:complete len:467 (-),score=61.11 gnl/TRDRNA2_/TRDRNA2_52907_c0_seq1:83-1483(-)